MRKYIAGFILGVGMVLGVAACTPTAEAGIQQEAPSGGMYRDTWHKMPDGRTVYCMYLEQYSTGYAAGPISFECDFANASVHP